MDQEQQAKLEKELARVDALYAVCVRDYFATFGAYATATSILLFGVVFVVNAIQSPWIVALLAAVGVYLCLQWHISTTSMRDQYTHFYVRMVQLERALGQSVMLRWHDAANRARRRPVPTAGDEGIDDHTYLTWSFRQIGRIWALRGISMPVIYSTVFLAIGLAIALRVHPFAGRLTFGVSLAWLVLLHVLLLWEIRSARKGKRRENTSDESKR